MAKDIRRASLRALVKEFETNGLRTPTPTTKPTRDFVFVKNTTNAAIRVGQPVAIVGFASSLDLATAKSRSLNGSIVYSGRAANSSDAPESIGTAAELIAAGAIGRVKKPDVEIGTIDFSGQSVPTSYASSDFKGATEASGKFYVVARSSLDSTQKAFCAVVRRGGSGGGGTLETITFVSGVSVNTAGNLVFTTQSKDVMVP